MKKLINTSIGTFFSVLTLLVYSCNNKSETSESFFPKDGSLCLQSVNTKTEFIQLEFKNGSVEGKLFMEEHANEKVCYALKGQAVSDTVLNITIAYVTDDITREWIVRTNGDKISINNILDRKEASAYSIIDCSAVPAASDYRSLTDIQKNEAGGYDEDIPSTCFECTYPGGGKRIVFREYIQLWNEKGKITGKGAGYSEGDPEWSFVFDGHMVNDTTLELKANYRQEGVDPFSTSEIWFVNLEKGSIRLKETVPANLRSISNGEYYKVACDYIPEDLVNLMNRPSE